MREASRTESLISPKKMPAAFSTSLTLLVWSFNLIFLIHSARKSARQAPNVSKVSWMYRMSLAHSERFRFVCTEAFWARKLTGFATNTCFPSAKGNPWRGGQDDRPGGNK